MHLTIHAQNMTIVMPRGAAEAANEALENQLAHAAPAYVPGFAVRPAPGEIWPGQGGHYVCTLPASFGLPARHLIVAADEKEKVAWGGYDSDCSGASIQTDGRACTDALLNDSEDHPAAEYARSYTADGHSDFHLPSRHDLYMCFLHAPQLFQKDGWYWSSSQYSRYGAWCQDFEYGDSNANLKGYEFRARPVRWIQL